MKILVGVVAGLIGGLIGYYIARLFLHIARRVCSARKGENSSC